MSAPARRKGRPAGARTGGRGRVARPVPLRGMVRVLDESLLLLEARVQALEHKAARWTLPTTDPRP
jgi:hypothetical protein